jgi:hypothetical protein
MNRATRESPCASPITCSTLARQPAPNMAALPLGANPRWQPRCGIDFVKYEGTSVTTAALITVKRIRFEAPLVLIDNQAVSEHARSAPFSMICF